MQEFKRFIELLTEESGQILRQYFRQDIQVETKEDNSPVTIADRKSEERMRTLIRKHYPDHGILGEEFGMENESAEFRWILDPIDGTKSFICGVPLFGTLIALLRNNQPALGAIHLPVQQELLIGDSLTTELNGKPVFFRKCTSLAQAVLLLTDYSHIVRYESIEKFDRLAGKVSLVRTWGDCYGYYLASTGRADIMIDPVMYPWDSLPLIPVIRGAGGMITDYHGKEPVGGTGIIVAVKNIHSEVVTLLNQ